MRKARLFALMTALLTLTACSSKHDGSVIQEIQSGFQNAGSIQFTADISADYGERVFEYGISYSGSGGDGVITISEPASIAGATVIIENGSTSLSYDGARVFTGEILPDGLSPVDAVPLMVEEWKSGLVTETVREKYGGEDCIAALFRVSDDVNMRTWFSESAELPLRTEVYFDGYTVLVCDFYNVRAE